MNWKTYHNCVFSRQSKLPLLLSVETRSVDIICIPSKKFLFIFSTFKIGCRLNFSQNSKSHVNQVLKSTPKLSDCSIASNICHKVIFRGKIWLETVSVTKTCLLEVCYKWKSCVMLVIVHIACNWARAKFTEHFNLSALCLQMFGEIAQNWPKMISFHKFIALTNTGYALIPL